MPLVTISYFAVEALPPAYPETACETPCTRWNTPCTPQKQPPANTAVCMPLALAVSSAAAGGILKVVSEADDVCRCRAPRTRASAPPQPARRVARRGRRELTFMDWLVEKWMTVGRRGLGRITAPAGAGRLLRPGKALSAARGRGRRRRRRGPAAASAPPVRADGRPRRAPARPRCRPP